MVKLLSASPPSRSARDPCFRQNPNYSFPIKPRNGRKAGPVANHDDGQELPRIAFNFNRRDYGRLRQMVDVLNGL